MPASSPVHRNLPDETATAALGGALAQALLEMRDAIDTRGIAIGLFGDLGAGKTTLVRGLLRQLGVTGAVKSPTFALLEPYEVSRLHLYHFDFYRFKNPKEFQDGGFAEYFGPGAICLVEWPAQAGSYLPPIDLEVRLQVLDSGRGVELIAHTPNGDRCLDRLGKFTVIPHADA